MADVEKFLVSPDASIRESIERIDRGTEGIALVVDEDRHLIGTVTDGDIRRAILTGTDLDQPVRVLLEQTRPPRYAKPLTMPVGTPQFELLNLMEEASVRHIPLTNTKGQVEDIVVVDKLVKGYEIPLTAVVMAGGYGTRLRPLTDGLPKPMLPLGNKPLLEHILGQLRAAGVRDVHVTTHYRSRLIEEHFRDGSEFGISIKYLQEDQPLGTAGAIGSIDASDNPVLVMNGDIVTKLDVRAMLQFHMENRADMTVAVRQQEWTIPYGIVEINGVGVTRISEKPTYKYLINAGIYLLGPEACRSIPAGQHYDMTDLISRLVAERRRVVSFAVREYWADIGKIADYRQVQEDVQDGRV